MIALLAALLLLAPPARAAAGWAPTAGAMSGPRWEHQAVLLDDGRVLVAGGWSALTSQVMSSAELYDPATGTWAPAASMNFPRELFQMAKLPDGRVLAAGGTNGSAPLASAEVYDPATNRWSAVGSLNTARYSFSLVPLAGGRLLAAGGQVDGNGTNVAVRQTEIFDAAHDLWTVAGDTTSPRMLAVAAPLPDGRVILPSGADTVTSYLKTSEVFDGSAWHESSPLYGPHAMGAISVLADGRPFVTGGVGPGGLTGAELYVGGQWRLAASFNDARYRHTQTTLPSGRVLIAGGQGRQQVLASSEVYDPATNTWSAGGAMAFPRVDHTATLLEDGRVLVAGGTYTKAPDAITSELYTAPTTMSVAGALALGARKIGAAAGGALRVTNTGDAPLFVSAAGPSNPEFAANAARCQGVPAGATCTIDIAFTPAGAGAREAVLTLNANTSPATVAVALSGSGVADTDGDGITDDIDRCGRQKGTAARQGCPAGLLADPSIRYRAGRRAIRVLAYYVKATKGAKVTVTCSRKACRKTVTKGKGAKRRIRIARLNGKLLRNGTKITITATLTGRLTTTVVDRVSRGRRIEGRPRCTPVSC